jgi:hypothetical protein
MISPLRRPLHSSTCYHEKSSLLERNRVRNLSHLPNRCRSGMSKIYILQVHNIWAVKYVRLPHTSLHSIYSQAKIRSVCAPFPFRAGIIRPSLPILRLQSHIALSLGRLCSPMLHLHVHIGEGPPHPSSSDPCVINITMASRHSFLAW